MRLVLECLWVTDVCLHRCPEKAKAATWSDQGIERTV